jgi:hypothetical protein
MGCENGLTLYTVERKDLAAVASAVDRAWVRSSLVPWKAE